MGDSTWNPIGQGHIGHPTNQLDRMLNKHNSVETNGMKYEQEREGDFRQAAGSWWRNRIMIGDYVFNLRWPINNPVNTGNPEMDYTVLLLLDWAEYTVRASNISLDKHLDTQISLLQRSMIEEVNGLLKPQTAEAWFLTGPQDSSINSSSSTVTVTDKVIKTSLPG